MTAITNLSTLQTQLTDRSRFKATSSRFGTGGLTNTNSLRQNCIELSDSAKELLSQAETIAIENLKSKKIVQIKMPDGSFLYNSTINPKPTDKLVDITGQDYFIVKAGSLGRKDDFLPHSDFDFIVFPSNEESIPYTHVLQKEITEVLKGAGIKTDDHLAGIYDFHIKLESIPEELLVTEKNFFEAEFQMNLPRSCIASRALRDLKFVSGNESAFFRLQEIIEPVIYPFENEQINARGLKLVGQLISETKEKLGSRQRQIDIKDDGLRLIQYYNWLVRARLGIKTNSVFESLIEATSARVIGSDDAQALSDTYSLLLQAKHALSKAREKVSSFNRDERAVITTDLIPQVSQTLGIESLALNSIMAESVQRAKAIISQSITSPEFNITT